MEVRIEESWKKILQPEFEKEYFKNLVNFIHAEYGAGTVFPPGGKIFEAFKATPFEKVKVVILGQDPYHDINQANGLCFSVNKGVKFPPSLLNIFKEIKDDIGTEIPQDGDLSRWAEQGVLLLNSTLTVRAHFAGSHQGHGWEQFTDKVIELLSEKRENVVFLLWGSYAIKKGAVIDKTKHLVLTSPHPSPLSAHRGFFGNHHFSSANTYLISHNKQPIAW